MASPSSDVEYVRRKGFAAFVQLAWHQIEGTPLVWSEHLGLICRHLEAVADGEIQDLCINVPPGTSKSTLCSVLFPVYCWIKYPWKKFIGATYDQSLSYRFAERSLDLMTGEWFKERWGTQFGCGFGIVKDEQAAVAFYENDKGGARYSTMMGGAAIGRHAHILMIDDPIKPDDLRAGGDSAKAALDLAWDRFINTFSTRRADPIKFARVIIMQRLHVEDVAGKFVKTPGMVHLRLPMEFEPEHAYKSEKYGSDWRTEAGELLCPARFPQQVVDGYKRDMTPRNYAAQHQQRPTPEAGALFQRDWFSQRWTIVPNGLRYLMSIDSSLKDGNDADYNVLQVWAWQGANYYLIDQVRRQMGFSDTIGAIKALKAKWPHVGTILVETKANGTAIIDSLRRNGVPGVLEVDPLGGKFARASAVEPFLRAGNCYFPDAYWMEGLIDEAITFPVGSHDDQVDCMTQALAYLTGQNKRSKFKQAMANVRAGKQKVLGVRFVL